MFENFYLCTNKWRLAREFISAVTIYDGKWSNSTLNDYGKVHFQIPYHKHCSFSCMDVILLIHFLEIMQRQDG